MTNKQVVETSSTTAFEPKLGVLKPLSVSTRLLLILTTTVKNSVDFGRWNLILWNYASFVTSGETWNCANDPVLTSAASPSLSIYSCILHHSSHPFSKYPSCYANMKRINVPASLNDARGLSFRLIRVLPWCSQLVSRDLAPPVPLKHIETMVCDGCSRVLVRFRGRD